MKKVIIILGLLIPLVVFVILFYQLSKSDEILIGSILPMTGSEAKYGESAKRGIDFAVEEINENQGIKGRKIKIIYEDDQANPTTGVSAARKLIYIDKVPAILGPLPSSVTLAVAPVVEENKVALLSPASSAPAITDAGDFIFRNVASDTHEGAAMAEFICSDLHFKRVAILYINNDFGIGLRASFKNKIEELCGEVVASESFEQGSTDFRTQLIKVRTVNPEGIYLVGYKEMGRILRQAGELGIESQFLSFTMFEDPEILEMAGNTAEGIYYTSRSYDSKIGEGLVGNFNKGYRSKYNIEPDIFAALSYDAVKILALAIRKGGFSGPGIRDALYTIKDFSGVTGEISFDENGDVAGTSGIKVVKQGEFVWHKKNYVSPAEKARRG